MSMRPANLAQAPSSRAAGRGRDGVGQRRDNITTPEPQWPATLSLKKGDVVRLVKTGNALLPEFPEAQVVIIKDYRSSRSPSFPAQVDQTPDDSDSIYGFKKRVPDEEITSHYSPNTGRMGAPKHQDLLASPSIGVLTDRKYNVGEKVYLQKPVKILYTNPLTGQPMALEAPAGTRCLIAQHTTSNDPRAVAGKRHSVYAVENSWYMIQVKISTPYWREVPCSVRKEAHNFEKLSSAEARAFFSDKNLPHKGLPTVISVSETDTLHLENN